MSSYSAVYGKFKDYDKSMLKGVLVGKMDTLQNAIKAFPQIHDVFCLCLYKTVFADSKISKKEAQLVQDLADRYWGHVPYDQVVESMKKNMERGFDEERLIGDFKALPEYIRDDLVAVCLIVANIDGEFSPEETEWISKLAF